MSETSVSSTTSDETNSITFSPKFNAELDPQYLEKLLQLEAAYNLAEDNKTATDLFFDFCSQFMMPKEFWSKLFELTEDISEFPDHLNTIYKPSVYHFYCRGCDWNYMDYRFDNIKICHYKHETIEDANDLYWPHKNLDRKLEEYEMNFAYSLIPKSIYRTVERMKMLYSKIKSAEKNDKEWFTVLLEVEDEKFIEDNIEYRIGKDLTDKKLWKMYIQYLKENNNQQKLLQTYSKYCRFFLDDSEMFEEYRNTAGEQKVSVPWKNPFEFEIYNNTYFEDMKLEEINPKIAPKSPLICQQQERVYGRKLNFLLKFRFLSLYM